MNTEDLSESLRHRLLILVREVLAMNATKDFEPELSFNRLSGAIYNDLLPTGKLLMSEDEFVNKAVELTQGANLTGLLARYDECRAKRAQKAGKQVVSIVNNMIPANMENRDQVVADTLAMLESIPLVRSIPGKRALVQARMDNGNRDVDPLDYMHLQ